MKTLFEAAYILTFILLVIVTVAGIITQDRAFMPFIFGILAVNLVSYLLTKKQKTMKNEMNETKELAEVQSYLQHHVNIPELGALHEFNNKMDVPPLRRWLKSNRASQGAKYLPIRRIEALLRTYFGAYQIEFANDPQLIVNSVVVSVHLKVFHPVLKEWLSYAGIGAVALQLDKGASASDVDKIKRMALHKNAPAALSFAVNNAAKKIGRIFGSDINSDSDEVMNTGDLFKTQDQKDKEIQKLLK